MQPSTGTATALLHTERGHSLRGVTTALSPGTGPPAASAPSVLLAQRSLPPPRSPLSELSCNRQGPVGTAFGSSHRAQARTRKPNGIMIWIRRLTQGAFCFVLLVAGGCWHVKGHECSSCGCLADEVNWIANWQIAPFRGSCPAGNRRPLRPADSHSQRCSVTA